MVTRVEAVFLALVSAALGWALWTTTTVERRVNQDMRAIDARAADRWTALVETGLAPDSATALVLADLRTRLSGTRWPARPIPFVADREVAWLVQAQGLNPFYAAGETVARDAREAASLRAARAEIRYALAAGRPLVREARAADGRRNVGVASVGWTLLAGVVAVRLYRRRRFAAQLGALRIS